MQKSSTLCLRSVQKGYERIKAMVIHSVRSLHFLLYTGSVAPSGGEREGAAGSGEGAEGLGGGEGHGEGGHGEDAARSRGGEGEDARVACGRERGAELLGAC